MREARAASMDIEKDIAVRFDLKSSEPQKAVSRRLNHY